MGVGRYKLIKRKTDGLLKIPQITTAIPTPTEKDYINGYIVRYFIQKANDLNSFIFEVDSKQFSKLQNSEIYSNVSLDWRIKGDPNEIKKSNSASVRIASQTIPKIQLYLPNLLQFYKK
jgi:hypothetical protein